MRRKSAQFDLDGNGLARLPSLFVQVTKIRSELAIGNDRSREDRRSPLMHNRLPQRSSSTIWGRVRLFGQPQ
jgi:hypothetical protein